jgi:hypothetical protein
MRKANRKQLKIFAVLLFIALLISYAAYWYTSTNPLSFNFYNPTKIPANLTIKAKRIDLANQYRDPVAEMNLRTEDWVYAITERDGSNADPTATVAYVDNYDPTSVKPTCKEKISPNKQGYRLCHWTDYDRIGVYEIKFMKYDKQKENPTFIEAELPVTKDRIISESEIDNFVDSFVKARTTDFKLFSGGI